MNVRRDRVKVFTIGFFSQLALYGNADATKMTSANFLKTRRPRVGGVCLSKKFLTRYGIHRRARFNSPAQHHAWPAANHEQREAVIATGFGLVDLWEISPVRFADNGSHTEELIDRLFPGNPLLCVGQSKCDFATRSREEWRKKLSAMPLVVPNEMSARTGHTQDGKESEHTLENTGARRFLVVEQDNGTIDEQAAVLLHLAERAPLVVAVHSGGKFIHGWFLAAGQPEETLRRFMRYAVTLGADRATWTRSQFVRMPDGTRDNGKRQTVYFFNPVVLL
jgi:hypothetical protein